jgi:hypothetical protein
MLGIGPEKPGFPAHGRSAGDRAVLLCGIFQIAADELMLSAFACLPRILNSYLSGVLYYRSFLKTLSHTPFFFYFQKRRSISTLLAGLDRRITGRA